MESFKKTVGSALKKRRKKAGFKTQDDLGKELGVDQSRVAKWESGQAMPSASFQQRLISVLGLPPDFFDPANFIEKNSLSARVDSLAKEIEALKKESASQENYKEQLDTIQSHPLWKAFEKATPVQQKNSMRALTSDPNALAEFEKWLSQTEKALKSE